ncbi:putative G-protein coupled receptor Mth-like 4 [Chionoecetes opilio]|uniref:Putative G-protein coupled receptor Mth-like 4 n=1 Tax=Chionoecetes opilio TaxID=41210 RepID=A0A8J4YG21_CHIOP|nr:putative G-protein coupled receptor Mth-like 4 [Chionoecetes opilio]
MQGVCVAVAVVAAAMVMPGGGASTVSPGLSWCSESTLVNVRVTKDKKPELSTILVMVNQSLQRDMVDEVFVRAPPSCEGVTRAEMALLDGEEAELVMQDGEINLNYRPPDTMPLFQDVGDFCISANNDSPEGPWSVFHVKFCYPDASLQLEAEMESCSGITCVRKCCPPNMAMAAGSMCAPVEEGEAWQPSLGSGEAATPVHMLYGPPRHCENALIFREFNILDSGMLQMDELSANVNGYCIDTFTGSSDAVALVCQEEVTAWHCEWKHQVLKPVLLGVSAVCLILVWLVYVSVARLRRSNEGRCLLSLVSALFVAYVTLIYLNFLAPDNVSMVCVVAGERQGEPVTSHMDIKWERPRVFCLYSLYAWSCPLLIVVVGVVLEEMQVDAILPYRGTCWFYGKLLEG